VRSAVIYAARAGLYVRNCVFSGNIGNDIAMANSKAIKFEVTDCLFSGNKPSPAFLGMADDSSHIQAGQL
jgi:hypothetical protein